MEGEDTKYYTLTFARYESERLEKQQAMWKKKLKFKAKLYGTVTGGLILLGLVYPVMQWFEYDINVLKPRMSPYLRNRIK